MDPLHDDLLLAREWLVKVDTHTSTPYLIKFYSSSVDLTCCIMLTDTKQTWAEVLSSKQFARRWRECNHQTDSPLLDDDDEDAWRTRSLDLLSNAHTLGAMPELSFEVVESKFADLAFQLECSAFRWRWETIFVGYKASADILSKHLITPLISMNHLAFSSPDVIGDLSPTELEKAIDRIARAARRALDTHIKNAFSKPRLATTIRRITAVFNFISDPPNILIEASAPVLLPPAEPIKKSPEHPKPTHITPEQNDRRDVSDNIQRERDAPARTPSQVNKAADSGSATEPEDNAPIQPSAPTTRQGANQQSDVRMRSPTPPRAAGSSRSRDVTKAPSDTDSSPVRPIKKPKPKPHVSSSDEDSGEARKKRAAQGKGGSTPALGLRQPIKRGGKRF